MAQNDSTNYKAGFKYTDERGFNHTLIKWVKVGMSYRWRVRIEFAGVTAMAWTDDRWIDICTGKAYLDQCENKIKYYNKQ